MTKGYFNLNQTPLDQAPDFLQNSYINQYFECDQAVPRELVIGDYSAGFEASPQAMVASDDDFLDGGQIGNSDVSGVSSATVHQDYYSDVSQYKNLAYDAAHYLAFLGGTSLNLERRLLDNGSYGRKVAFGSQGLRLGVMFEQGHAPRFDLRIGAHQGAYGVNLGENQGWFTRFAFGLGRIKHIRGINISSFKMSRIDRGIAGSGEATEISFKTLSWKRAVSLTERRGLATGLKYFLKANPSLNTPEKIKLAEEAIRHGSLGKAGMALEFAGALGVSLLYDYTSRQLGLEPNPIFRGLLAQSVPVTALQIFKTYRVGDFKPGFRYGMRSAGLGTVAGLGSIALNMGGQLLTSSVIESVDQKLAESGEHEAVRFFTKEGNLTRRVAELTGGVVTQVGVPAVAAKLLKVRQAVAPVAGRGFLTRLLGRAGLGLLAVQVLDSLFKTVTNKSDYIRSVDQRATDRVYADHVYKIEKTDALVVPLLVKGLRIFCREMAAPQTMNATVASDNPEIRERIIQEDHFEIVKEAKERLMCLVELGEDKVVYLTRLPVLSSKELQLKTLLLSESSADALQAEAEKSGLTEAEIEKTVAFIHAEKIRQSAKFLRDNFELNPYHWAKTCFSENGVLYPAKRNALYRELLPQLSKGSEKLAANR